MDDEKLMKILSGMSPERLINMERRLNYESHIINSHPKEAEFRRLTKEENIKLWNMEETIRCEYCNELIYIGERKFPNEGMQ